MDSCSSDEGLGKEDESKVRRTAATKPGAPLHSGSVMMQGHLGRQVVDPPLPQFFFKIVQGIAGATDVSNFLRAFLMVSLNSLSSGSMK